MKKATVAKVIAGLFSGALVLAAVLPNFIQNHVGERYKCYGPYVEAWSNLRVIRLREMEYFAEWETFVGEQGYTPIVDRRSRSERVPWDPGTRFSVIGFAPEGSVYCSYRLEGPAFPKTGFTAVAQCDIDGDGALATYTISNASEEIAHSGDEDEFGRPHF